jgi:hypothetical protein
MESEKREQETIAPPSLVAERAQAESQVGISLKTDSNPFLARSSKQIPPGLFRFEIKSKDRSSPHWNSSNRGIF